MDFCMNINEVKTKYSRLRKDINFDRLDLELKNPNIFQEFPKIVGFSYCFPNFC